MQTRQVLDKMGVEYRTLVPTDNGVVVHVFDQGHALGDRLVRAAQQLGADVTHTSGKGAFIGGDTREEGRRVFETIIGNYKKAKGLWAKSDRRPRFLRLYRRGTQAKA